MAVLFARRAFVLPRRLEVLRVHTNARLEVWSARVWNTRATSVLLAPIAVLAVLAAATAVLAC